MRTYAFILAVCISHALLADHIRGGNITWECIGPDQYEVTTTLFRDCASAPMDSSISVGFRSWCGASTTLIFELDTVTQISRLCVDSLSSCNGGALQDVEAYSYTDTVILAHCNVWIISWQWWCCRNADVLNLDDPSTTGLHIESTLDRLLAPCNDSPHILSINTPMVCVNQPTTLALNVIDPDGNDLRYELIGARKPIFASSSPVLYNPGYSGSEPIAGIVIDSLSGELDFTVITQGTYVVVVLIEELNAQGDVIATVLYDFQVVALNCNNALPLASSNGMIMNLSGTGSQRGPYAVELCAGDDFCFDFSISDPDQNDTLTLTSNVNTVLPGSSLTLSGTNPVTGTLCWTAPTNAPGNRFVTFNVNDSHCPVLGTQNFGYLISVLGPDILPDQIICGTQTATLFSPDSTTNWSVLAGDPIAVGQNFSCNPCTTPVASPTSTTTYVASGNLSVPCVVVDTVMVQVVPDFANTISLSNIVICPNDTVQVNTSQTPAGNYTFAWSPALGLSDSTSSSPLFSRPIAGVRSYTLFTESSLGCRRTDTAHIEVFPGLSATVDPLVPLICVGQEVQFNTTVTPLNEMYTFNWSPGSGLDDSTIANPVGIWNTPGAFDYQVGVINSFGCSQEVSVQAQVFTLPNQSFIVTEGLFSAVNANSAYSYQWLDCNANLAPIPGAIGHQYFTAGWANLALAVTFNGCADTTACQQTVGIAEAGIFAELSIYPNPASDHLEIALPAMTTEQILIYVTDNIGNLVHQDVIAKGSQRHLIQMKNLSPGAYLLTLTNNGRRQTYQFTVL